MGNIYITVKSLLDDLQVDYVIPPYNNKKALELGIRYSPETACIPLKMNIGNYIQAYEMGADTILTAGGCGPCRYGYYSEMTRHILKDSEYNMEVIALEVGDKKLLEILQLLKDVLGKIKPIKIINAIRKATVVAQRVDALEELVFKLRPREVQKGCCDKIYEGFQKEVLDTLGSSKILNCIETTNRKLLAIELNGDIQPLKIGIVGDIYTTIDQFSNYNINKKLGSLQVQVHRFTTISEWIVDQIIKKTFYIKGNISYQEPSKKYIGAMIGGHAQETVGNTVLCAQNGYDGVIQIFPFGCTPEIVAKSMFPAIEEDNDLPIMTLIMDEMTGEAGYVCRLEAFVDCLTKRREEKRSNEGLLYGNRCRVC